MPLHPRAVVIVLAESCQAFCRDRRETRQWHEIACEMAQMNRSGGLREPPLQASYLCPEGGATLCATGSWGRDIFFLGWDAVRRGEASGAPPSV
jgi:hypothetical protein